jgi:hypothetical protein
VASAAPAIPLVPDTSCRKSSDHAPADAASNVLRSAYREPLTPADLMKLWPDGPSVGGFQAAPTGSATR